MERTRSGFRNANGNANQQPVIARAPEVAVAPEPITIAGVQAIIHAMMAEQREEMRQMLQDNRDEPIVPIVQPELNIEQSDEGNYNQTVNQAEPRVVRRNHPNGGNDGRG